ncbi:MAG: FG-GAP-like repeat-containing protein [Planctomycetota bacterium]
MTRPESAVSHASLLLACLGLGLPSAAFGQGFVERSGELGIDHEVATGFDAVSDTTVRDWIQRGLALGDIDGDGDVDLVACGGVLQNSVLRNDGGVFTDITAQAGIEEGEYDTAPCLADYDGDGDLDLYIGVIEAGGFGGGTSPRGRFYRNDGTGAFEEITTLAWVRGSGHTAFAQWADIDYDGLADLLLGEFYSTQNHFYRNNGDGTFTDRSVATGLNTEGMTHVLCVFDSDRDGYFDVFVGNDYYVGVTGSMPNNEPDVHMDSQSGDTWLDVSDRSGFDHERGIMGYALGDVNYDGLMDVYKTDVFANRLTINQGWPGGDVWLGEEQLAYGVAAEVVPDLANPGETDKAVGWGTVFMDFDFDLWLDLFLVNGQVASSNPSGVFSPRFQRNFMFTGDGPGNGFQFTDRTSEYGLYDEIDDRILAVADVDQDGDVDMFIQPTAGYLRYFENQIDPAGQGWLMVKPECNTSVAGGFGVEASFTDSLGYPHIRQIGQDGPTAAQHENFAYFGLGNEASVDLEVVFPSGIELSFPAVTPNQVLVPVEPKLLEVNARTMPTAVNPGLAGTRNGPTASGPPGLYAVTAFAHDQAGNPLDGTATVTIETPGLTALTGVLHLGGNQFRRYFEPSVTPGDFRTTVTFDGWEVKIRPRIHFYDPTDASGTTALVQPEAVRAGSGDTFTVVLAPKDANGISLGAGDTISISVPGLAPVGGVVDHADGRYSATFPAPATAGVLPIGVTINGAGVPLGLQIEAGGVAINSQTILQIEEPYENISAAPHQLKIQITPRDMNQLRTGPAPSLSVVPMPDVGTDSVVWRSDVFPQGQRDGDYVIVVEKPLTDPPTYVSGVLQLFFDGAPQANIPYDF